MMKGDRAPQTKARILLKDGKYYLERGRQRHALAPLMASEEQLQALEGKEVELATVPQSTLVGFRTEEFRILCYIRPRWMCYLPRPEFLKGVEDQVRRNLLDRMLQEGVIDKEIADKLR